MAKRGPKKKTAGELKAAGYDAIAVAARQSGDTLTQGQMDGARRNRHNDIAPLLAKAREGVDWKTRRACSKSLWVFIDKYLCGEGGVFAYRPFAETRPIVETMELACSKSTPYHVRMTRGGGKTTLMIALILWRLLYGTNRYVVISAAVHALAQSILDDIYNCLENCDSLARDFPEICLPIKALNGSSQKARVQHCGGVRTQIKKDSRCLILPTVADSPASGSMLVAVGFDGAVRGLRHGSSRPDLILLDDLQTDEIASSAERVEAARNKIAQSYLGLGSSVNRPAILMTSTPIRAGDLSEQYAESPDWVTQTFPLMWTLPTNLEMWKQWGELRKADIATGDYDCKTAARFYVENRKEMDKCAVDADGRSGPLWKDCFNKEVGEVSAIEHAMRILFGMDGERVFWSEYQMKPPRSASVYEIDYRAVLQNCNGLPMRTVPRGFDRLAASIDVMSVAGLRWAVYAFGTDSRAACVAYGRFPANDSPLWTKETPDAEQSARLIAALNTVVGMLRGANFPGEDGKHVYRVGPIGIDSGWKTKAVHAFCDHAEGCYSMKGISYKDFSPRRETGALRVSVVDATENYFVSKGVYGFTHGFLADYWRETAQRSWLVPRGSPNGLEVNGTAAENATFAMEQCGDRLTDKLTERNGKTAWTWKQVGPNHFLDCTAMALALGSWKHVYSVNPDVAKIVASPSESKASTAVFNRASRRRRRPGISMI